MEFEQVREALAAAASDRGDGATEAEILEAESLIGAFPQDYRQYLKEFGWVVIGNNEVYGLGRGVPDYLNVARMTLVERQEPAVPLPGSYVCVMNDGGGNLLCFDSGQVRDRERNTIPIKFWNHELDVDQRPEVVADSFADWLMDLLEGDSLS
jgi:hypothetical protein